MPLFDSVHNYYEELVWEQIQNTVNDTDTPRPQDFLEDIACLALNQLPPKYVREDVDTSFYLSVGERESMEKQVYDAVQHAWEVVSQHPQRANREQD